MTKFRCEWDLSAQAEEIIDDRYPTVQIIYIPLRTGARAMMFDTKTGALVREYYGPNAKHVAEQWNATLDV